jgi:hypothetical protein
VTQDRAELAPMGTKDVNISLNPQQARELYDYLEGDDCPPYWETALAPVHEALREALRRGEW